MGTMASFLTVFVERLARKSHLRLMTAGWERRVGIVVEDQQLQLLLRFSRSGVECTEWLADEAVDLVLRGQERDLLQLFAGEELVYLRAKQFVSVKGPIRDQLKMDALLRLTC